MQFQHSRHYFTRGGGGDDIGVTDDNIESENNIVTKIEFMTGESHKRYIRTILKDSDGIYINFRQKKYRPHNITQYEYSSGDASGC